MAAGVSFLNVGVSLATGVSLGPNTPAMAAIGVNVIGDVSLSGGTATPPIPPPPGVGPAYQFFKAGNSMYLVNAV